jgi:hypothetical protein
MTANEADAQSAESPTWTFRPPEDVRHILSENIRATGAIEKRVAKSIQGRQVARRVVTRENAE